LADQKYVMDDRSWLPNSVVNEEAIKVVTWRLFACAYVLQGMDLEQ
jgi:hypothetical protein